MVLHRGKVFILIRSNSSFSPLSVTLLVSSLTSLRLVLDPEGFLLLFFFFIVLGHALRLTDLIPPPGMEPESQQWKCRILSTGLPGNSLPYFFSKNFIVLNLHLSLWSILIELGFMQFHSTHIGLSIQQQLQIWGDHYADFQSSGSWRHWPESPALNHYTYCLLCKAEFVLDLISDLISH